MPPAYLTSEPRVGVRALSLQVTLPEQSGLKLDDPDSRGWQRLAHSFASGSSLAVGQLADEGNRLATSVVLAHIARELTEKHLELDPAAARNHVAYLAARVPVRRLSFASPLEVALVVPPALFAAGAALTALLVAVKRIYALDLEFQSSREEQRALFYEAKRRADEAHNAWLDGRDPKVLSADVMDTMAATVEEAAERWNTVPTVGALEPRRVLLIDEDSDEPISGLKDGQITPA